MGSYNIVYFITLSIDVSHVTPLTEENIDLWSVKYIRD